MASVAACLLAALPLAALAGCAAAVTPDPTAAIASKSAEAAPMLAPVAAKSAARVALQFDPNVAGTTGPAPAAIAKFRWSALAGSPLGDRNSPLLAWADGRLLLWSLWQDAVMPGTWGTDVLAMNARGVWRNVTGSWPQGIAFGLSATSDGSVNSQITATPV